MRTSSTVTLPNGTAVPIIGQGTWNMGDARSQRSEELDALRTGLDLGATLIDTAEMYGSGASEDLVGEAIAGRRDEVFLVTKVLPSHASRRGTVDACHESLRRLGTDTIDLYLLHWRGRVPLTETVEAFESLVAEGAIRSWGVSNFDTDDLAELPSGVQTDQILYNLTRRGPELDLLPQLERQSVPVMAYSPVEQGRLIGNRMLLQFASDHNSTPAAVALAWSIRSGNVIAIPKASTSDHVRQNVSALGLQLSDSDLQELDRIFPPPTSKVSLEML